MNADTRRTIDTLLDELKTRLAIPGQSLLPLLAVMSRFSRYSLANQMLIFAQRPAATHVLGYRSWLKAGYQVRKGEKGIAIYAPMRFTREDPDTLEVNTRTGFKVAWVFDLSQVDALTGTDTSLLGLAGTTASPAAHRANEQLKAFLFGHNVELAYQSLAPGLMGYTDGRRITCGLHQPTHVEFATLAHETAHVLLHFPTDGSNRPDLVTRETEAEAVTFLLCSQLGLDGTEASIEYIQSYRGTPDTLDGSLERIRTTAMRLATELARDSLRHAARSRPG